LGEAATRQVLHHDEVGVRLVAGVEHGHDVRMIQRRGGRRLTLEPCYQSRIPGAVAGQDLDRDGSVEHAICRAIHDAHAASTDDIEQLIAPSEVLPHAPHPHILPGRGDQRTPRSPRLDRYRGLVAAVARHKPGDIPAVSC
jgi:hypothetical protein